MTEFASTTKRPSTVRLAHALEEVFARHQSELLGVLYYLLGDSEDARDAFQDAFLKCWRRRDQLDRIENLKAWVFRVAINTARDLRQTAWRRRREPFPQDQAMIECSSCDPQTQIEQDERLGLVRQALQKLRVEEQEVFLLRQNGQLTYEQIGQTLGLPTGTVKTRMRLAVSKLRQALS